MQNYSFNTPLGAYQLVAIPSREDNYIWILHNNQHATVIDPGESKDVIAYLKHNKLILKNIVLTHHHYDHIDGVPDLIADKDVQVWGQSRRINAINQEIGYDGEFEYLDSNLKLQLIQTPGHTYDHVCYLITGNEDLIGAPLLFCGDTLFSGGCGRVFDGSLLSLFNSLNTLSKLSDETLVVCAHEYTQSNLDFALRLAPEHQPTLDRLDQVRDLRANQCPTLPSTLATEKATNPFLRIIGQDIDESFQLSLLAHIDKWCKPTDEIRYFVSLAQSKTNDSTFAWFSLCRLLKNSC